MFLELGTNGKGETIAVEINRTYPDNKSKYSLPVMWYKHGFINRVIDSYINVTVYCTEPDGTCYGRYNPTVREHENKLNFDWMLEATDMNEEKILKEIKRRAGIKA